MARRLRVRAHVLGNVAAGAEGAVELEQRVEPLEHRLVGQLEAAQKEHAAEAHLRWAHGD